MFSFSVRAFLFYLKTKRSRVAITSSYDFAAKIFSLHSSRFCCRVIFGRFRDHLSSRFKTEIHDANLGWTGLYV